MKKELKVLENVAEDTCNDVDYRAPPRRSQNNIWSKTQSGQLPYDSPHTTSEDDGENPANHSDRLSSLKHPEEEEPHAENSRADKYDCFHYWLDLSPWMAGNIYITLGGNKMY